MSLCIEIYKIFSNLNFEFRKGALRLRMTVRSQREKDNLNLDEIVLDIFFFHRFRWAKEGLKSKPLA